MAATLKRMLKRKSSRCHDDDHRSNEVSTTFILPTVVTVDRPLTIDPLANNTIGWKKKSDMKQSSFYPTLMESKRYIRKRARRLAHASALLRSKRSFDALSSSLVLSNHPRKFLRRLKWNYQEGSNIHAIEHESYLDLIEEQDGDQWQRPVEAKEAVTATQPFVSLVPERRRFAALCNAIHYLSEDGRRRMNGVGRVGATHEEPKKVCCHESLLILLGRESNICFGCGQRKPLGLTLCWPCYEQHLAEAAEAAEAEIDSSSSSSSTSSSFLNFLSFTVGTRMGPDNCGEHQDADNAAALIHNSDDYILLQPRIGLQTSVASTLLTCCPTLSKVQVLNGATRQLGLRIQHPIKFIELLQRHSKTLLMLPSDRFVVRTQTLPSAWKIAICIAIVAQRFKLRCPSLIRREFFMKKTVARLRMRTASAAFNKWHHMVQEVLENRKIVQGALKKFLMRAANKAFNQWHEFAHKSHQTKALARRVIGRQLGALLIIYFEKWADAAESAYHEKQRKIQAMIIKWRMMPAMLAFKAWHDVLIMMKKGRKFARRILMLSCARSLNAWLVVVEDNKRVRRFLRRQMLRMQKRREARLFDAWVMFTDLAIEIKEEKIRKVLHRINMRWERQFVINLKSYWRAQKSARRLQCFARRIRCYVILLKLQKAARRNERKRVKRRRLYVSECVESALQAATKTFRYHHPSVLRSLVRVVKETQQRAKETSEVSELLTGETGQQALDLFTKHHAEESIQTITLEGVTPEFMNSLNDVVRKRTEEENQERREIIWEEMDVMMKVKHLREHLNIQATKKLLARDFIDERTVLFESAWRSVDPGRQLVQIDLRQCVLVLKKMKLICVRGGDEALKQLMEEKGVFPPKIESPTRSNKNQKKNSKKHEDKGEPSKRTHLSRSNLKKWIFQNTEKIAPYDGLYELRGFNRKENILKWISTVTGTAARREAERAVHAVVREEAEEFGTWYYDQLYPPSLRFECGLCSNYLCTSKAWLAHTKTCNGKVDDHERYKHRSIPFRCAAEMLLDHPNILKAAINGSSMIAVEPDAMVLKELMEEVAHENQKKDDEEEGKEEGKKEGKEEGKKEGKKDRGVVVEDVAMSKEQLKEAAALTVQKILGEKQATKEELDDIDRKFQENILATWGMSSDAAVDEEFDAWVEEREEKRKERISARHSRRAARETRRNRRKQAALAAKWAHKKFVLQQRVDQLNAERVFVAGSGATTKQSSRSTHVERK